MLEVAALTSGTVYYPIKRASTQGRKGTRAETPFLGVISQEAS
jgi:hypothetical protein